MIYYYVSLCSGGRITANISPPYRTKIEYFIRRRDINNSYRPVFSGQLKSFCRIDDISYAQKSSDTGSATRKNLQVCDEEPGKIQRDSYFAYWWYINQTRLFVSYCMYIICRAYECLKSSWKCWIWSDKKDELILKYEKIHNLIYL